jgi:hypothetical protein
VADLAAVRNVAEKDNFFAVVTVARGDGTVHASVVKAGVLDDPIDGAPSVGLVVAGASRKLAYLRRNGQSTVVFKDAGRWAAVQGPVRLIGPEDASPSGPGRTVAMVIREVYRAAGGEHDDWEQFDRVMSRERRCAVFEGRQGNGERLAGNAVAGLPQVDDHRQLVVMLLGQVGRCHPQVELCQPPLPVGNQEQPPRTRQRREGYQRRIGEPAGGQAAAPAPRP